MSKTSDRIRAMRFDIAVMRHMPRFRAAIRKEKNRFIDAQMEYYKRIGKLSDTLEQEHAQKLESIYRENYRRIMKTAVSAAPGTISGIKASDIREVKYSIHESALFEWFTTQGGARVKRTARVTANDVRKLVSEAFQAGEPETDVIRAGLRAKGLSAWRANTIARTETHNAAAFASRYTAETIAAEAGLTLEKKWQPTLDERTRPAHMAMATSDYIGIDAPFIVDGEELDYPGDPSGSPENVINCRCVELRQVKRDYL